MASERPPLQMDIAASAPALAAGARTRLPVGSDRLAADARLVRAAAAGDETAFARLYEHYARVVHGILLARVDWLDVDDLVQEVFIRAWTRLNALRDPAAFGGWIAAIARNRAIDHHRRDVVLEGTIHARIWAPPKFFFVNTPAATAIDLGCAYTLEVAPDGSGLVRVTHGWVAFEHAGRESFIPERAVCATRPGSGPGTPRYEDAPDGYAGALEVLDFAAAGDQRRAAALDLVLSRARGRDALTLWHLLQRGAPDERARVFDRMATIAPPPPGVTREDVLKSSRRALDAWWNSLGLDSTTWWRIWKKNW